MKQVIGTIASAEDKTGTVKDDSSKYQYVISSTGFLIADHDAQIISKSLTLLVHQGAYDTICN